MFWHDSLRPPKRALSKECSGDEPDESPLGPGSPVHRDPQGRLWLRHQDPRGRNLHDAPRAEGGTSAHDPGGGRRHGRRAGRHLPPVRHQEALEELCQRLQGHPRPARRARGHHPGPAPGRGRHQEGRLLQQARGVHEEHGSLLQRHDEAAEPGRRAVQPHGGALDPVRRGDDEGSHIAPQASRVLDLFGRFPGWGGSTQGRYKYEGPPLASDQANMDE